MTTFATSDPEEEPERRVRSSMPAAVPVGLLLTPEPRDPGSTIAQELLCPAEEVAVVTYDATVEEAWSRCTSSRSVRAVAVVHQPGLAALAPEVHVLDVKVRTPLPTITATHAAHRACAPTHPSYCLLPLAALLKQPTLTTRVQTCSPNPKSLHPRPPTPSLTPAPAKHPQSVERLHRYSHSPSSESLQACLRGVPASPCIAPGTPAHVAAGVMLAPDAAAKQLAYLPVMLDGTFVGWVCGWASEASWALGAGG